MVFAERAFIAKTLIVALLAISILTLWLIADVLLLAFGSVLIAIVLSEFGRRLSKLSGLSYGICLAATVVCLFTLMVSLIASLGPVVSEQIGALKQSLPAALTSVSRWLGTENMADFLAQSSSASALGNLIARIFNWGATLLGVLASAALVIVGGVYLAAEPNQYRTLLERAVQSQFGTSIGTLLNECAAALRRWLKGQLLAMAMVGALTGMGLWALDLPSAAALALIAAAAEFVPIFGPIFAFVPAVLMASAQGGQTVVLVTGLYLAVQQLEANVLTPLIAKRTVNVPPAIGLFGVVAMGIIFGPVGLLFGYPLLIVLQVVVRNLSRRPRSKSVEGSWPTIARIVSHGARSHIETEDAKCDPRS